jgi:hypothetical protein
MPSLANCLQMRLAAGVSLPRVNPCAKTPQPLTDLAGWSMSPASLGPLVLANHTRSATRISWQTSCPPRQSIGGLVTEGLTGSASSAQRGAMGKSTRRRLSTLIMGLVLVFVLELGAVSFWVRWTDQKQYVSQHKLEVALLTFYHSPHKGQADALSIESLIDTTLIAHPAKCVPLAVALTSVSQVNDTYAWSGTAGQPPQWTNFLTIRFSSAVDARHALLSKRVALAQCRQIRASFPPFDQQSELYRVSDRSPISPLRLDRVRYTLSGENSYEFYMRQFANTLTWTYGSDDNSSTVRAQAVDNLVARLQELEGL